MFHLSKKRPYIKYYYRMSRKNGDEVILEIC